MAPKCTMQSTRSSTAAGCPAFEPLQVHRRVSSWCSTTGTWAGWMAGTCLTRFGVVRGGKLHLPGSGKASEARAGSGRAREGGRSLRSGLPILAPPGAMCCTHQQQARPSQVVHDMKEPAPVVRRLATAGLKRLSLHDAAECMATFPGCKSRSQLDCGYTYSCTDCRRLCCRLERSASGGQHASWQADQTGLVS